MTFYWWSHWFWITLLAIILLPPYASVHTYPSQEYNNTSLEYNQNSRNIKTSVTKLYQTAATGSSSSTTTTSAISIEHVSSTPSSSSRKSDVIAQREDTLTPATTTTTTARVFVASDEVYYDASVEGENRDVHGMERESRAGDDVINDDNGDKEEIVSPVVQQRAASNLDIEAFDEVADEPSDVSAGDDVDGDVDGDGDSDAEDVELEYKRSAEIFKGNTHNNNNNNDSSKNNNNNKTMTEEESIELPQVAPLHVTAAVGSADDGALSKYTNFSSSAAPTAMGSSNATQGHYGNNSSSSSSSSSDNNNSSSSIRSNNISSSSNNRNDNRNANTSNDAASITKGSAPLTATMAAAASATEAAEATAMATATATVAPPAVPKIVTAAGSAEWINAELAAAAADAASSIDHSAINITADTSSPATATNITTTTDNTNISNTNHTLVNGGGQGTGDDRVPFTLENANKEDELRRAENEHRTRKSKTLSADYKHINRFINYSTDSKTLLARSASTATNTAAEYEAEESNISSEALSVQRAYFFDAGAISAICFTIFGVCCAVGTVGIVLYRRRYMNKPQALSEPDSSVYIDDSTMRVSDNSDEMYSLDNDSFLNSLEAMTIQNYWTDTVKHTKL